ncbi:hypothetical protein BDV95DRAFT_557711 [Massariosphaeria phaeospora]|uniref:Secreted protein n=1 Tax=Massariosphaeria phaeospora TaxID=100035 RepID=A0A7C8MHD5_9PLEO|nr:hypothetical protein BDV95DRAFT_557711 [Massariosphaeria phaeospora]
MATTTATRAYCSLLALGLIGLRWVSHEVYERFRDGDRTGQNRTEQNEAWDSILCSTHGRERETGRAREREYRERQRERESTHTGALSQGTLCTGR